MDNPNPDKVAKVAEIAQKLESAGTVLVADYRGLDVPAQAQLRQAVRDAGGEFKIYKNTLTRLAADRTGVDLTDHLLGPTALAFAYPSAEGASADPVSLSKALTDFAKTNENLVIKGGVMDGAVIDADDVTALSKIPSRDEMLAKFAGLLQAPMAKFAGLLSAMPREFAGLLKALIDKRDTGADEAPADGAPADAPADEAPAEAAADDAAADEAPADEAPADEAPADEAPADEAPADEAPADEAAAEEPSEIDAVEAPASAASDQTDEAADAGSEETDDKED